MRMRHTAGFKALGIWTHLKENPCRMWGQGDTLSPGGVLRRHAHRLTQLHSQELTKLHLAACSHAGEMLPDCRSGWEM